MSESNSTGLVDKVSRATLAMQRHSWEQGVVAQAFLELGDLDTVILLAKEAAYRQVADGRLAMVGSDQNVTDPAVNGEPLLAAARATGDPALLASAERMCAYLLEREPCAKDGTLYHLTNAPQIWIDSGYMVPPFLALMGHYEEALCQIEGFQKRLWDPGSRAYAHIWNEQTRSFTDGALWGVGGGWMLAGMARVVKILPAEMESSKQRLVGYVREGLDGYLAYQRPDGLFHDIVDDPTTFVETNLAQMLAYTIYRGMQGGWLGASYRVHADRMRAAAQAKVDTWGLVQGVCGAPNFDKAGVAPEGQAFFLLMEAAARDYEKVVAW